MACRRPNAWRCLAVLIVLPVFSLAAWWGVGGMVNTTPSLPYGFYITSGERVERDRLASFCLPVTAVTVEAFERGYLRPGRCAGGWAPLIKRVVAVGGDHVRFSDEAVYVNDHAQANSARVDHDPQGRPMPRPAQAERILAANELLLMSDYNAHSFDGRYFDVVEVDGSAEVVEAVFTWDAAPLRLQAAAAPPTR